MKSVALSTNKYQLPIVLFVYSVFALIFGSAYRYAINPDGVSLLRLAGYLAEGNFQQSVTSGWSPLMTWVIAVFLYFGLDGLSSARIAIALCGAGLLLSSWLLALRCALSQNIRFIAGLISALLISVWTIYAISSDVLLAALTLFYIYLVTDPDILKKKKILFVCGMLGGLSFLAHHYALPFFLAHFPAMLFLRSYIDRKREDIPYIRILIPFGIGISGFLMISSLWIVTVSVKYGHFSISSKGGAAHAIMGPKDIDRRHPFFVGGLYKPRDSYAMHVFEDPSNVKFKTWSPFESKEYFMHQLTVVKDNVIYILNHFVNKSPFFTYAFVIGILAMIPVTLLLTPLNSRRMFLYSWVIVTFCIYSSGFVLLIARSPRRFYALMIIFVLLSFHFMEEIENALKNMLSAQRKKTLMMYLLIIVISAFSIKPGLQFLKSIKYLITYEQVNPYQEMAKQINTVQFPSPYAIIRSSQKPHTDTFIAYYLNKQLLGRPLSKDVDGITEELKAADGRSLLVFDKPELVKALKSDNRYVHLAHKEFDKKERYEHTVNINISEHEIITGWDSEVDIFGLK